MQAHIRQRAQELEEVDAAWEAMLHLPTIEERKAEAKRILSEYREVLLKWAPCSGVRE